MAAYGGPLMELIRLPSAHRIFFRASVYEASPGARFARATGRRIIKTKVSLMPNCMNLCLGEPAVLVHVAEDSC